MDEITAALSALEQLSSSPSTSASGPLNALLEQHFAVARQRIIAGSEPRLVIQELMGNVARCKKEVEKGLKGWYVSLGGVGKAVEKAIPPNLAGISDAYASPPLFSEPAAKEALDKVVMESLGRRGLWEAVSAMEEQTDLTYHPKKRALCEQLYDITSQIEAGNLESAIAWCQNHIDFLNAPPHPSSLPYHLHRAIFLSLPTASAALNYANEHLLAYVPTQPVLKLVTSCLFPSPSSDMSIDTNERANLVGNGENDGDGDHPMTSTSSNNLSELTQEGEPGNTSSSSSSAPPYADLRDPAPLVEMFQSEFCRRHGLPKEDLLSVAVGLGGKGGALGAIERARRMMVLGDQLGNVREWQELPMEIPLPGNRRYHSVFVCPVSKEQATDANPPLMLSCGHVIATESFQRLVKGGRRSAKCPYCPVETSQTAAQRLYF